MAEELKAEHAPGLEIALKAMLKHRVAKGGVHLGALALLEGMIEEARAQLHSQGGEAVAEYQQLSRYNNWDRIDKEAFDLGKLGSCPERFRALYTHPADQVADGVVELKAMLPALDDALEDLELHGRHSDQGYRKLKDWYRKVALITDRIDALLAPSPQ